MSVDAHRRHRTAMVVAAATGAVLVGFGIASCAVAGAGGASPSSSASADESGGGMGGMGGSDTAGPAQDVAFSRLLADPEPLVGAHLRVTGNVFFLSQCPPPGATTAPCILVGYLAAPEQRTLIAAEVPRAVALAEGGALLTCQEGGTVTPACGDWTTNATYTVEGTVQHQVLGGKETSALQFDVTSKSAPKPF